jgi:pSer/pThr/pTyr-binding forkhead associated (FHA) protein
MHATLQVLRGAKPASFSLRLPTVIGRGVDASIKLPAATVSRHHCELYEYDGQLAVRDLSSSNGTLVNGHKIEAPTFLTPQDELTVGPVTLSARYASQSDGEDAGSKPTPSADAPPDGDSPSVERTQASSNGVADQARGGDGSVLDYTETAAGSFIGITSESETTRRVEDAPRIDGIESVSRTNVEDDSALGSFLQNLDG